MRQVLAPVTGVSIYEPLAGFLRLDLRAPALCANMQPGQFVLVDTQSEYVRRPFFPIALSPHGCSLLIPPDDPMRRLGPGDALDCIGPLGRGFSLPSMAFNLLLIAQEAGLEAGRGQNNVTFLSPLMDQALAEGKRVLLIHEATTAARLFPPAGLPTGVEVRLVTADGSRGSAGSALELLPELAQWADQVCVVGDPECYSQLVRGLRAHRLHLGEGFAWGLIAPEIMPCGTGACGGCVVDTQRGYRLACVDGPVFDLSRL